MDEKKEYSIIGRVEIGTDEYRDLIEDRLEAQKNAEYYRSKFWEQETLYKKISEENAVLRVELDKYKKFIKDSGEQDKMELWILKLGREE